MLIIFKELLTPKCDGKMLFEIKWNTSKKAHRKKSLKGAVLVISFNTLFMIDESIHGVHGVNFLIYLFFFFFLKKKRSIKHFRNEKKITATNYKFWKYNQTFWKNGKIMWQDTNAKEYTIL